MSNNCLKTVIFIDGENLYYNLRSFEFQCEGYDKPFHLEPQHVDWKKFFDVLVDKLNEGNQKRHFLHRIYWYVVESVSPWREPSPWKLNQAIEKCKELGKVTSLSEEKSEGEEVRNLARQWYNVMDEAIRRKRQELHSELQKHTDFLQFRYIGRLALDPFKVSKFIPASSSSNPSNHHIYKGTIFGEKGVDVGLAVDMVSYASNYDAAVLVSGDADFVPAVFEVKRRLRWVYQFSLAKGVPPYIQYLSEDLKAFVDKFIYVDELTLLKDLLDYDRFSDVVKSRIQERIDELDMKTPAR